MITFGGDNTSTTFSGQIASITLAATTLALVKTGTGTMTIRASTF
jgi:hypothetical protein